MDLALWRKGIIGAVGCAEGSSGLYALSGRQTVSVEVIEVQTPNTAVLTPNPAPRMFQGDSLVFLVRPKYTNTGEFMELRAPNGYAWGFRPDSTALSPSPVQQAIPGCGTWDCNFKATASGTIKVAGSPV